MPVAMKTPWERRAADELRALLRDAGMSYSELADALNRKGSALTALTLTKRLYRGTFTHAFFLECKEMARVHSKSEIRKAQLGEP